MHRPSTLKALHLTMGAGQREKGQMRVDDSIFYALKKSIEGVIATTNGFLVFVIYVGVLSRPD